MDEYQLPTAHATILSESTLLVDYFNFYVYLALHAELFELAHLHSSYKLRNAKEKADASQFTSRKQMPPATLLIEIIRRKKLTIILHLK